MLKRKMYDKKGMVIIMKLTFENLLYDYCLEKLKGYSSTNIRNTYPGTQALEAYDCYPKTVYISSDSENTSGFSQKKEMKNGEFLFAIVANKEKPDEYNVYVFTYSDENGEKKYKPYPPGNGEVKILNGTGKWSLTINDKPTFSGEQGEVNNKIIEILKKG